MDEDALERTAVHESGDAVIAHHLGLTFTEIELHNECVGSIAIEEAHPTSGRKSGVLCASFSFSREAHPRKSELGAQCTPANDVHSAARAAGPDQLFTDAVCLEHCAPCPCWRNEVREVGRPRPSRPLCGDAVIGVKFRYARGSAWRTP